MSNFHFTIDVDFVRGSEKGLIDLYDFCAQHQLKPTLFITGKFAAEYPDLIQEAASRGYALGTHGWQHGVDQDENFATDNYEKQKRCIAQATEAVHKACGVTPDAFRAPNLSICETTLRVLEEEHYRIDSSVPSRRFDLGYGQVSNPKYFWASLSPYNLSAEHLGTPGDSTVVEIAPSAFFVPINMSGLRVLGLRPLIWAIRRVMARSSTVVFYLHPAEFVPFDKLHYVHKVPRRHAIGIGPQNFVLLEEFITAVRNLGLESQTMHSSLPQTERIAA